MANTADGFSWLVNTPVSADPRKDGAAEILGLRVGMALRLDKEHVAMGTYTSGDSSTGGGEHKAGSAVAFMQDAEPTARVDTDTSDLDSSDDGRLWVDTTGATYVLKVYENSPDDEFKNVSGVSQASGNFTGAELAAASSGSPETLTCGFVPDVVSVLVPFGTASPIHGFTFTVPTKNLTDSVEHRVEVSTGTNSMVVAFKLNGTDVEVYYISGLTPIGQCEWLAYKF